MSEYDELLHYDTVATGFISIAGTILALIAGFLPIVKLQGQLNSLELTILVVASVSLVLVLVMNMMGLVFRHDVGKKKRWIVPTVMPLFFAIFLILIDIFLFAGT